MQMIILSHVLEGRKGEEETRGKRLLLSRVQSKSGMYPKGETGHVLLWFFLRIRVERCDLQHQNDELFLDEFRWE